MIPGIVPQAGARFRVLTTRVLARLGLTDESFLVLPAILIGIIAAAAAVAFHELIDAIRWPLYGMLAPTFLYGSGVALLILFPAIGGLLVGVFARFFGAGGHGVPEVIESVIRTQGFTKPISAIQRILTSSITIGTGGSAGAEGPIIQIGAAIASGVGHVFRIARHHMPILVGCGAAAGISAVFNSPIGGVLFTLEVILQEFSIRTFTPLVIASVVANVATQAIFQNLLNQEYNAIFVMPQNIAAIFGPHGFDWAQLPNFALLGLACGLAAVLLTTLMLWMEKRADLTGIGKVWRPAIGGAAVGVLGVAFVTLVGWWMLGKSKPFEFAGYHMPAFFGDGYGVVQQLLRPDYYVDRPLGQMLAVLFVLCLLKIVSTCLTLASGGSGGIIAPSLFVGATAGACVGILFQKLHLFADIYPAAYALVGMGAVLGAVVHAPLASILILLELTRDYHIVPPAMLATIIATGVARFIFPESIYTAALKAHGIRLGSAHELSLLRRVTIEQIGMEPALVVRDSMPVAQLLDLMGQDIRDAVSVDAEGNYTGLVRRQDLNVAMLQPGSLPLLVAGEIARAGLPLLASTDDLSRALELFAQADVDTLPVCVPERPKKVVGIITHQSLMSHYHEMLGQK